MCVWDMHWTTLSSFITNNIFIIFVGRKVERSCCVQGIRSDRAATDADSLRPTFFLK